MFSGAQCAVRAKALVNCCGEDTSLCLDRIFAGVSGVEPLRRETLSTRACDPIAGLRTGPVGQLPSLDPSAVATRQDQVTELALQQLSAPLADVVARYGRARVAVVLGTSTGGIRSTELASLYLRQNGTLPAFYNYEEQHLFDAFLCRIMRRYGMCGPAYVVSTACSSSAKAISSGARLIHAGLADAVLAGGVDSLCLTTVLGFASLGVVAPDACRPFAADRAGMNVAEGAAFLVLERSNEAGQFLISAGETNDAHHVAHPHPEGFGAERAMRQALTGAKVQPDEVDYVNAHGTGTVANDAAEAHALRRVLGSDVRVSSTKGLTGHQLGAAGAAEAVITCAAIERGQVPGNGGPAADDLGVKVEAQTTFCALDLALSNSLAFGGSNASLLFASKQAHVRLAASLPQPRREEPLQLELRAAFHSDDQGVEPCFGKSLLGARAYGRASPLCRLFADLYARFSEHYPTLECGLIFGSAYGEVSVTRALLELQQAQPASSSPLKFQASVHNSAAGQLSIACGHTGFSTAIAAGHETPTMALLEAAALLSTTNLSEALVLLADEAAPAHLSLRKHRALSVGFLLRKVNSAPEQCHRLTLSRSSEEARLVRSVSTAKYPELHPMEGACDWVAAFRSATAATFGLRGLGEPHVNGWTLSYQPPRAT